MKARPSPLPPAGFVPHDRSSPLTAPWEPIYARLDDRQVRLGLYIRPEHTNRRGMLHGGLIAALADNAMGLSLVRTLTAMGRTVARGAVTISLSVDYIGQGSVGDWLEIDTSFVHVGGSQGVTQAFVRSDARNVARANAIFRFS